MLKKWLNLSFSSGAILIASIAACGINSYSNQISTFKSSDELPTPEYVQYLQNHWGWNDKLKSLDATGVNYNNAWKAYSSIFSANLSFMGDDFSVIHSGEKADATTYNHGFYSLLANFGIMIGVAYGQTQNSPQNGQPVLYFNYPVLGINQTNLLVSNFAWNAISSTDQLLEVRDLATSPSFHYSIEFIGTGTTTARDMTQISVRKYDDATTTTNYKRADINYDTSSTAHTIYTPSTPDQTTENAIEMTGATFQVAYTENSALTKQKTITTDQTLLTTTNLFMERNMLAFHNTIVNQTYNTTTHQLLGMDTSVLASGTTPTQLNLDGINYISNYTGLNSNSMLSTGAIIGITVASCVAGVLLVGLSYLLYQRYHHKKPSAKS